MVVVIICFALLSIYYYTYNNYNTNFESKVLTNDIIQTLYDKPALSDQFPNYKATEEFMQNPNDAGYSNSAFSLNNVH